MGLIRASGLNAVEALYRLTVKIWRDCSWPDIWNIQEIVLLHKGGSPKDCSNYRTIALISHASKILLIILLNRIRQKFENELPDEQRLQRLQRRSSIAQLDPPFLRTTTYLMTWGFPDIIVALIQALYEKQSAIVRWNESHTKPFFIEKGVRQGCILYPLLFCAYTEHERGRDNRIRRGYWRKINLKFTVRR